jgi:hypothetical protein
VATFVVGSFPEVGSGTSRPMYIRAAARGPRRAWRIREDLFSLNNAVGPSSAVAAPPAEAEHVEVRCAIFRAWILGPRA